MRTWIQAGRGRAAALIALTVVAVAITATAVIPQLAATDADMAVVAQTPTASNTKPSAPASAVPTPTSTAETDVAPADPTPPQPAAPPAPAPAPAPAQPATVAPGIIAMNPGAAQDCGETPHGQTVYRTFDWTARDGNTVDIYYAYTETDVQATSGFVLLSSGLPTSGSVQIPRSCPNGEGILLRITVKAVANNASGSATAYYWGL